MTELLLRELRAGDEAEAIAAHRELLDDGFSFLLGWSPAMAWADYLAHREDQRRGVHIPEGRVPSTFLVAELRSVIVGRVSIRHELNEHLEQYGGHIGYCVRPAWRRQGVAREMLRQALALVPELIGNIPVLVTCDRGNAGSRRVIESCGGVFDDERFDPGGQVHKQRFWIRP